MAPVNTAAEIPPEFVAAFRDLCVALQPRGLDRAAVRVYYAALKHLPIASVAIAAQVLAASKKFFPTSGEWSQVAHALARSGVAVDCCETCAGKGLLRVQYPTNGAIDIAICACRTGLIYREFGAAFIRQRFALPADCQVAPIEEFAELDAVEA